MDYRGVGSIFFVLISIAPIFANDVPALIWSPSRPMSDLPTVFMGNKISADNFHANYLLPLSKESRSIVIFIQDNLGLNHLSHYADIYNYNGEGGVFKNVKKFMEDSYSTNLASVSNPMAAVEGLKRKFLDNFIEVHNPLKIASMKLNTDKSHLFLVHLPDLIGSANEETTLKNNDDLIAKTLKDLKDRGLHYSAVLTGDSPDKESAESNYLGRQLLQVKDSTNTSNFIYLFCATCPFYAQSISLIKGSNKTKYVLSNLVTYNATGTNKLASYMFTLQAINSSLNVTFKLDISLNNSDWYIDSFDVEFDLNGMSYSSSLKAQYISAPKLYSYHCTKMILASSTQNSTKINVEIIGLQIQPFDGRNGTFTNKVWDCTGFFSIGIWMGLISTIILGLILAFGLCMIIDIKTMDRFDDPKGKMFSVPVVDG